MGVTLLRETFEKTDSRRCVTFPMKDEPCRLTGDLLLFEEA